jgi:hypothetical protein
MDAYPLERFLYPSHHAAIQVVGTVFLLGGLYHLDKVAEKAMKEFRPALDVSDARYADLC